MWCVGLDHPISHPPKSSHPGREAAYAKLGDPQLVGSMRTFRPGQSPRTMTGQPGRAWNPPTRPTHITVGSRMHEAIWRREGEGVAACAKPGDPRLAGSMRTFRPGQSPPRWLANRDAHGNPKPGTPMLPSAHACMKPACVCERWGGGYALDSKGLSVIHSTKLVSGFKGHPLNSLDPHRQTRQ